MSSSSPSPDPNPSSPSFPETDLHLSLRLATHPVHPSPSTHAVSCRPTCSILQLKEQLYRDWDGKPKPEGITVIKGGRVCRDTEVVKDVFSDELNATPPSELVLHVVVRASAWSAPFTASPPPPPLPAVSTPSSPLPTINTIPPSPLPSPPKDEGPVVEAEPEIPLASTGYSPSYVAPIPSSSPPSTDPAQASPSTTSSPLSTSNNPYLTYLGHLQRLIPIQRSLLLLNLQKAHYYYQLQVQQRSSSLAQSGEKGEAEAVVEELGEVESLLKECGLWSLVQKREDQLEEAYRAQEEETEAREKGEQGEFKVVQIEGLPYLLHTPPSLQQRRARPSLVALKSVSRAESILKILTTLLQLLITFQPTSPSIAHGRTLYSRSSASPGNPIAAGREDLDVLRAAGAVQRPPVGGAGGGGPPYPARDPAPRQHHHHRDHNNHRAVRRAATISITLHLDSLVQFLLPLFFLSLKLAFLLFVFARHASPTKRYVLIGMAVMWVLWEGVRIARRRRPGAGAGGAGIPAGEGRDRDRERERGDRERRRLARDLRDQLQAQVRGQQAARERQGLNNDNDQPVPQPNADQPRPAPPPVADAVARPTPRSSSTSSTSRREPPSIFSPKYWINSLAAVGLVAEARDLGLSPRYIAGRPISSPNRPFVPLENLSRWERQKHELRRLVRVIWVGAVLFVATLVPEIERKRKKALEKRDRLLAEKKVRWEKEREKEERDREKRLRASQSATGGRESTPGGSGLRKRLQGREKVSDEELFKDGSAEAFSPGPSTSISQPSASTSSFQAQASTESIPPTSNELTSSAPSNPSPPSPNLSDSPPTPLENDVVLEEDLEDEGDGDIAASASVSDNSDDEGAAGEGRGGQGAGNEAGNGDGDGEGAVVAIF
ncbi:uncharacterized protein JCM6883_003936 [Sporobolomyces salmoneus]|uniref:uncharacterized protein n=1 Tax=Sporobolomyces salmoneus TaxID=183962 RepID=UPI0031708C3B